VDDPHVGTRIGGQRDARVRRHGGRRRHTWHDLEADPRLGAGRNIAGGLAEDERIALVQPDHLLARLRGPGQHPRVLLGAGRIRDHGVGAQQMAQPIGQLQTAHHQVRLGQKLSGPHRQQPFVPRPGTHKGDKPGF
jgi:hypothetical protein